MWWLWISRDELTGDHLTWHAERQESTREGKNPWNTLLIYRMILILARPPVDQVEMVDTDVRDGHEPVLQRVSHHRYLVAGQRTLNPLPCCWCPTWPLFFKQVLITAPTIILYCRSNCRLTRVATLWDVASSFLFFSKTDSASRSWTPWVPSITKKELMVFVQDDLSFIHRGHIMSSKQRPRILCWKKSKTKMHKVEPRVTIQASHEIAANFNETV